MKTRLNAYQVAPDTIKALSALEAQVPGSGLEQSLIELVKTRASQINGCAFCINMHTQDARKHRETEQRLYLLNAWRESTLYTVRVRPDRLHEPGGAGDEGSLCRQRFVNRKPPLLDPKLPLLGERDHRLAGAARQNRG